MDNNSDPVSDMEPTGLDMLAAAIRFDSQDIHAYGNVLVKTISDIFPSTMLNIERVRSLSDKLKGQSGYVKSIKIQFDDLSLLLLLEASGPRSYIVKEVRGVTISKQDVPLAEWITRLQAILQDTASRNAENAEALKKLLG